MEVSLTKTLVQPEAGADASGLPLASGAGAIFDALMAAAVPADQPTASNPVSLVTTDLDQAVTQTTTNMIDPATQSFATDMEQMVQALAITAEVVVKGLAERAPTPPVALKAEVPTPADDMDHLPELTVKAPLELDAIILKITPGPALNQPAQSSNMVDSIASDNAPLSVTVPAEMPAPEMINHIPAMQADVSDVALAAQSLIKDKSIKIDAVIEPHGPFRMELNGPFVDADKSLLETPVFTLVTPETSPVMKQVDVQSYHQVENQLSELIEPSLADTEVALNIPHIGDEANHDNSLPTPKKSIIDLASNNASIPNEAHLTSLPVLIVKVPMQVKYGTAEDAGLADSTNEPTKIASPDDVDQIVLPETDRPLAETLQTDMQASQITAQTLVVITQNMPQVQPHFSNVTAGMPDTCDQPELPRAHIDAEVSTPLLVSTVAVNSLVQAKQLKSEAKQAEENSDLFEQDVETQGMYPQSLDGCESPIIKQNFLPKSYITRKDTNISDHVANSSSRSNGDIRNLVKLGVRDIEIIQGSKNGQAAGVNTNVQIQAQDLIGNPSRPGLTPPVTEAVVRENTSNNENRAEAHEIRMRAIERQVINAAREGTDTIRMQLYPPGLGQVMIRLTMEGARLKLSSRTSSNEATESLRGLENDLREALESSGLELTGFDVSEDNPQREGRQDQPEQRQTMSRSAKSDDFALDMNA